MAFAFSLKNYKAMTRAEALKWVRVHAKYGDVFNNLLSKEYKKHIRDFLKAQGRSKFYLMVSTKPSDFVIERAGLTVLS